METIDIKIGDKNLTFKVEFTTDTDMGEPWKNSDGHGVISDWTTRPKRAGELLLNQDRNSKRYYDFAESCRIALREGWDAHPFNDGTQTKRQQADKAARADYEFLRAWCNDEWHYVIIDVTLLDEEGEPTEVRDTLCGVETWNDCHETQARRMVDDLAHGFGVSWDFVSKTTFGYTQGR